MFVTKIAIFLLWFGAVIDPIGNFFGIRYVALVAAFAALALLFLSIGSKILDNSYRGILILFLAILFPYYGLTLYSFRAGNADFIDTSYIASGVLITTSLLYFNKRTCEFGVDSFIFSTRFLSFLIISTFLLPFFSLSDWISFFTERNIAIISFREYAGIQLPYIYFLASPLLIFLMSYDFCKFRKIPNAVNFLIFTLSSFSFSLTGTRAHIIIAILFAPLYILLTAGTKNNIRSFILFSILMLMALIVEQTRLLLDSFFSIYEESNSIKISLLNGYIDLFSNPLTLMFGQGFNAHEWSLPLKDMVAGEASKTELTYLELIRVFGLFVATSFMLLILFLLRRSKYLHEEFKWIYPGLTIFLTNAAINPYLFSVNGILPLGLISAIIYHSNILNNRKLPVI